MRIALSLAALALLAGCGSEDGEPGSNVPPAPSGVALEIRFDDGEGHTRRASLRCRGGDAEATGYLEDGDPAALCRGARAVASLLTEEPPARRVCTQIFGGPQTARVTGTLGGADVDRRFSRHNGCRIAEWDRLREAGLLPAT